MNIKNLFRKQPKFKKNINRYVTINICSYNTKKYLDDNKNIIGFMSSNPYDFKFIDFYYSLFSNKQIIRIMCDGERSKYYNGIITSIELAGEYDVNIYYNVLNSYVEN